MDKIHFVWVIDSLYEINLCINSIHSLVSIFFSISKYKISIILSLVIILLATTVAIAPNIIDPVQQNHYLIKAYAQMIYEPGHSPTDSLHRGYDNNSLITSGQNEPMLVYASGHFANNQMENGVVTWIQGGLWNLEIKDSSKKSMNHSNMSATFNANFTMIKPDGSLSHNHLINNFTSNNVILAGNDIVVTGLSSIHSDNGTQYAQVPITIHLMGKKVLGLMIDANKTGGHFSSSNEMFGTLISGIGLDSSNINNSANPNPLHALD
ncbi:MAG: hypothetical protein P0116_00885 [Candidatus Nitrosocosmicus sp.]|nr:hypothetical protein [Candidatus Nitrosocosmicus sp.]